MNRVHVANLRAAAWRPAPRITPGEWAQAKQDITSQYVIDSHNDVFQTPLAGPGIKWQMERFPPTWAWAQYRSLSQPNRIIINCVSRKLLRILRHSARNHAADINAGTEILSLFGPHHTPEQFPVFC